MVCAQKTGRFWLELCASVSPGWEAQQAMNISNFSDRLKVFILGLRADAQNISPVFAPPGEPADHSFVETFNGR